MKAIFTIRCPECEETFSVEEPELGEVFPCKECGLNLQVIAINEHGIYVKLTETDADDWGQ